jgi:2-methylisocitrate lyase-like PEP mutase family enzyme
VIRVVGRAQKAEAVLLRTLHDHGTLVLPNAWDAGSAVLIARAGATAIATTSGGVAWSAGGTHADPHPGRPCLSPRPHRRP